VKFNPSASCLLGTLLRCCAPLLDHPQVVINSGALGCLLALLTANYLRIMFVVSDHPAATALPLPRCTLYPPRW
jgi:hypothetical protein